MTDKTGLSLKIKVSDLDRETGPYKLDASVDDMALLVERFGLVALTSLTATVSLNNKGPENGVLVDGQMKAEFVQRCISTLQDVPESLDLPFKLLLVDPAMAERMDADESYLDPNALEYDALEGDSIDIGDIVAQTLAISMNPYPRLDAVDVPALNNPNVTFNEPELGKPNPFSVLGALKDKS